MLNARIDFNVQDLSVSDIAAVLTRLDPILHSAGSEPALIDASTCQYLGPTAVVVLASIQLCAVNRNQALDVRLPSSPPPLEAFCRYSGLAQLCSGAPAPDTMHPANETAALQRFDRASWGGSTPLVDLVHRHSPNVDEDTVDLLRLCYQEIAQNIEDHAQSPIGGLACGRYMSKSSELRIAVADRGLGIAATLCGAGIEVRDDVEALELVLRGDISSRPRANNMGQGISNLAAIAAGNGGRLLIASQGAAAEVSAKRREGRAKALRHGFPGTLVSLALPLPPHSPS
ncbi:MAG: hypothetical protein IT457_15470 [Planctomycetes bacterium]|nr:hypothetical protein [Planctomycetota bacterium]